MKKLLLTLITLFFVVLGTFAQQVDIYIYSTGCADFEVRLKPTTNLTNTTLTNIQFTVKWPETSSNTSIINPTGSYVAQQGSTVQYNGFNYATFVGVSTSGTITWSAGTEYTILSFSHDQSGTGTGDFVIMPPTGDDFATISTVYYVEVLGIDRTGSIFNNADDIDLGKPAITLGSNPAVCQGETSADLSYSSTTYSPDLYSIDFDATAEAAGFVDVVDASLPSSPVTITIPGAADAGTYNGTLTVKKSANGCESDGYGITITVDLAPDITNPGNQTACDSYPLPTITGTNLTGGEAYYDDSHANGGQVITSPITSSQTVWIYDASTNGCSDEVSFDVTINTLPNNTSTGFSGNTICQGEDGMLTFNAIDNTWDLSYYVISYTDGTNTWSQSISNPGNFSFNVAENPTETTSYSLVSITNADGCTRNSDFGDATAEITVNALPNPPSDGSLTVTYDGTVHTASAGISSGETVDWYTTETGSTPSAAPTATNSGVYTAWAEARNTTTGCVSDTRTQVTLTIEKVSLDLTVFLQGPYDNTFGIMNVDLYNGGQIPTTQPYNTAPWNYTGTETATPTATSVDWVLVELRSDASTLVARSAALLNEDGSVTARINDVTYPAVVDGASYYVVVWHRNHMPVMSGSAQTVPVTSFDFTSSGNLYGSNPAVDVSGSGLFAMVAGDVTHNGVLQYSGPGNDRGPIIAKIVQMTGSNNINGVVNNVYMYEDVKMNNNLLYIGTDNDRGPITDNISDLIGPELNNLYTSEIPGAVSGSKEQISNDGSFDLALSQHPSTIDVEIINTEPLIDGMIDNIQFTLAWNAGDTDIEKLLQNFNSAFMLSPQGKAVEYNGIMHQVYVSINPVELPEELNEGEILTVISFENPDWINISDRLWIADNAWTETNNGMYYVSVWGENNTGSFNTTPLGMEAISGENIIRVYPNPVVEGKLGIEISAERNETMVLTIFDMYGKLVEKMEYEVFGNEVNRKLLDLAELEPGAYLLTISGNDALFRERVIIK